MESNRPIPASLWTGAIIAGGLSIGTGLLIVALILVIPQMRQSPLLVMSTGVSLIALLVGLGLIWAGLTGHKRVPSPIFYARWSGLFFLFVPLVLILVAVFIPGEWQNRALFAPVHLGVAALPPFFILSLLTWAAGRERTLSLRALVATSSGGAFSVLLALPVEGLGFALSAAIAVVAALLVPGGSAEVERLVTLFEQWAVRPPVPMEQALADLFSPVTIATLALTLGVAAPLIEEFGKTLVMGVMGIWKRPGLTRAFLWGVACGLGFAVVEGVTNGSGGLGETTSWIGGMGSRALATTMHMLASGIIGLGWGYWWRKRRWLLPLAYVIAVVFHGLWNFNVVVILSGVGLGMQNSLIGFILSALGVSVQVLLALFAPVALIAIPLLLRRYENKRDIIS